MMMVMMMMLEWSKDITLLKMSLVDNCVQSQAPPMAAAVAVIVVVPVATATKISLIASQPSILAISDILV